MSLTKHKILKKRGVKIEPLDIPEWADEDDPKGTVYIRALTARERDAYEASQWVRDRKGKASQNLVNLRARFAVLVLCDEAGRPLFTELDVTELGRQDAGALNRVFEAGYKLSGMDTEADEVAEKNSVTAPCDCSSAATPCGSGEQLTSCSTP
jgi:hypothetical protein